MRHTLLAGCLALAACSSDKADRDSPPPSAAPPAPLPAGARSDPGTAASPTGTATPRRIELAVTEKGFEPTPVKVTRGQPLELIVTRKTETTCATDIVVKDYNVKKELPLGKAVVLAFTPARSGELRYGCSMDQMISGVLLVE